MGDWASLPSDLLNKIAEGFHSYADYVRARAVCLHWSYSLPGRMFGVPWLLLPYEGKDETVRGFYNLLEQKVYRLNLPEACGKQFRGSSHGWLLTTDEGPELCLVNPFTRAQIHLPPKTTFPSVKEYCPNRLGDEYAILHGDGSGNITYHDKSVVLSFLIEKVVLSSSAARDGCTAVAIYGPAANLAYCRPGDEQWKELRSESNLGCITDAIFYAGKLYAINQNGHLFGCDMNVASPKLVQIMVNSAKSLKAGRFLVGCSDGFMMVDGRLEDVKDHAWEYKTTMFNVFKLNLEESCWYKVKSISNSALLLGFNSSVSIPSHVLPKGGQNCIYFTDNEWVLHQPWESGGHDMGVFSLEDGSFRGFHGCETDAKLVWPPPVWVMPEPHHYVASTLEL